MKNWALLLGAAALVGATAVTVALIVRRNQAPQELREIPEILDDCFDRIQRIETALKALKSPPEQAA